MTVDLTGLAVTNVRDWPSVAAITTRVRGGELAPSDVPPAVVLRQLAPNFDPFGNTRRVGLQQPLFVAICYGRTYPEVAQVAGAVVDSINLRGRRWDAQGRYVFISLVEGGGGPEREPVSGWLRQDLTFSMTGTAEAVTP